MTLKKSFQAFKKNFSVLFLFELGFWFSVFFFLVYVKKKLFDYIAAFNQYSPQLAAIQQAAQENVLDNNAALQALTAIEGTTKDAMFFAFIIVPLVLFILWCLFQGGSWLIIKEKTVKNKKSFLWKFVAISFVIFALFVYILKKTVGDLDITGPIDTAFFKIIFYGFIAFYLIIVGSLANDGSAFKQISKKMFQIGIKKAHHIVIPIILCYSLVLTIFFLFFILFNSHILNNYFFLSFFPLLAYFLLCLTVFIFFKVYLQNKVAEIK